MNLSILYRGSLVSCNYGCEYCPFAKRKMTRAEHTRDQRELDRFVAWVAGRIGDQIGIFFTPWGEALIHPRYQRALSALSNVPHVRCAVIQTNLACRLDWIADCKPDALALWTTYHPGEVTHAAFVAKCHDLIAAGVRFSVGIVGLKAHFAEIAALRDDLPPSVYVWINAYKRAKHYYTPGEIRWLTSIDPLFPANLPRYPSAGCACRCGDSVIAVDGAGTIRRCHFVRAPLGNIYTDDLAALLTPTPCPNATCHCHIGYVHMPDLELYDVFGDDVLARIPRDLPPRLPHARTNDNAGAPIHFADDQIIPLIKRRD